VRGRAQVDVCALQLTLPCPDPGPEPAAGVFESGADGASGMRRAATGAARAARRAPAALVLTARALRLAARGAAEGEAADGAGQALHEVLCSTCAFLCMLAAGLRLPASLRQSLCIEMP